MSAPARLQVRAVWRLVDFLLEGCVFVLIGQQLPTVVRGLDKYADRDRHGGRRVTSARCSWCGRCGCCSTASPAALAARPARPRRRRRGRPRLGPAVRAGRWLALPLGRNPRGDQPGRDLHLPLLPTAAPFPPRDLLLFCTFLVVLVTLVGQGLDLRAVRARLHLPADAADQARLRNEARAAAVRAGLAPAGRDGRAERHDEAGRGPWRPSAARWRPGCTARAPAGTAGRRRGRRDPGTTRATRPPSGCAGPCSTPSARSCWTGGTPAATQAGLRVLERGLDHEEGLLPARATGEQRVRGVHRLHRAPVRSSLAELAAMVPGLSSGGQHGGALGRTDQPRVAAVARRAARRGCRARRPGRGRGRRSGRRRGSVDSRCAMVIVVRPRLARRAPACTARSVSCPARWWPRRAPAPAGRAGACGRWPAAASRRRRTGGRARRPRCRSRRAARR